MDLCICPSQKTRAFVRVNDNKCPNCAKRLTDVESISLNILTNESIKVQTKKIPNKAIYVFPEVENFIHLKLPSFDGNKDIDPRHFFVKIRNYFEFYRIHRPDTRNQVLIQALNDKALDLFLTLGEEIQTNLDKLESIFVHHFRPIKHIISETQDFLCRKKSCVQSVSQFLLEIRKRGKEIEVSDDLIRVVFLLGLPSCFQEHIALRKANNMDKIIDAAIEFEKIQHISMLNKFETADVSKLSSKMDEFLDLLQRKRPDQQLCGTDLDECNQDMASFTLGDTYMEMDNHSVDDELWCAPDVEVDNVEYSQDRSLVCEGFYPECLLQQNDFDDGSFYQPSRRFRRYKRKKFHEPRTELANNMSQEWEGTEVEVFDQAMEEIPLVGNEECVEKVDCEPLVNGLCMQVHEAGLCMAAEEYVLKPQSVMPVDLLANMEDGIPLDSIESKSASRDEKVYRAANESNLVFGTCDDAQCDDTDHNGEILRSPVLEHEVASGTKGASEVSRVDVEDSLKVLLHGSKSASNGKGILCIRIWMILVLWSSCGWPTAGQLKQINASEERTSFRRNSFMEYCLVNKVLISLVDQLIKMHPSKYVRQQGKILQYDGSMMDPRIRKY